MPVATARPPDHGYESRLSARVNAGHLRRSRFGREIIASWRDHREATLTTAQQRVDAAATPPMTTPISSAVSITPPHHPIPLQSPMWRDISPNLQSRTDRTGRSPARRERVLLSPDTATVWPLTGTLPMTSGCEPQESVVCIRAGLMTRCCDEPLSEQNRDQVRPAPVGAVAGWRHDDSGPIDQKVREAVSGPRLGFPRTSVAHASRQTVARTRPAAPAR